MTTYQHIALGVCLGACFVVTAGASFLLGRQAGRNGVNLPVNVRTDTLVVRDTIREKYPVYVDRWKTRTELVEVRDTVTRRDTLWMALDFESRTYQGDDYRAVVTGFRPELQEIAVYPKTVYLQTTVAEKPGRRTRLGMGVAAGPGIFWDGSRLQPGIGAVAGISLTF